MNREKRLRVSRGIQVRRRRRTSGDDQGSLAMLMVVMIVGMGLALLMLPLVMTQTGTTTFDAGRGRELQAAESGLDIGVGMIRAGRPTEFSPGDFAKLPCVPVSGAFAGSRSSYTATFAYYPDDPVGKDANWLNSNAITWNCGTGSGGGLDDPAVLTKVETARYVLVTATGKDDASGRSRTLTATYVLGIMGMSDGTPGSTDTTPPDGSQWPDGTDQIRLADSDLCVTTVGKNVTPTLESCSNPDLLDQQRFMVTDNGYIQLLSRKLCLKSNGNSGALTTGTCTGNSWIRYPQFPDSTLLIGFNQPSGNRLCLQAAPPAAGSPVNVTQCNGTTDGTPDQWWITILRPGGPGVDPGGGPGDPGGGSGGDTSTDPSPGVPYIAEWPGMQNLGEK